jgi:hypothetical protein
MLAIEQLLLRTNLIVRPFSEMAAGVYVTKHSQVKTWQGRMLVFLMEFGLCGLIGVIKANLLLKTGLKYLIPKGLMFGMSSGAIINALVTLVSKERVQQKDPVTNIFYILKAGVYGVVTTLVIAKISDKSLFKNSQVPIEETPYVNE